MTLEDQIAKLIANGRSGNLPERVTAAKAIELARPQWQPIETAPKDGTGILAFNGFMGVYATKFTTRWTGEPFEQGYEGFPCGFAIGAAYPFGKWDCQPTHWMPLPDPPTK